MAYFIVIPNTIIVKLCILTLISLTQCILDGRGIGGSYNTEDVEEFDGNEARGKRNIFSIQNNFMFAVLKQSAASVFFPMNSEGKLDFITDQYPTPDLLKEYDFVIVGAGPAGCVLANRLTESGRWSVLLLEVGKPESVVNELPMMVAGLEETDYAWKYPMERNEETCLAMNNQTCYFAAGKGVGGGSIINYMIYSRGTKRDYDKIAEAGNTGWSFDEVLPYFIKSENAKLGGLEDTPFHGKGGLLSVEHLAERSEYADAFLEAARELKQNVWDINNGKPGFGYVQTTMRSGRRHSAAKAFLYPIRYRKNLHVLPGSRATRVQIEKDTKTAEWLEYVRDRKRYKVKAKKEIILSAGALVSPKLLILSGIGPKEHLEELNIPLVQDLKVGEALFEHVAFAGLVFLVDGPDASEIGEAVKFGSGVPRWFRDGSGPLANIGGVEAVGFINTNVTKDHENSSDVEIILLAQPFINDFARTVLNIRDDFYEEYFKPIRTKRSFIMLPILLTPKSQGYMKLKDSNPFHWPKFYGNLFKNEQDLDTMVAAIRFTIKLSETEPFKRLGTKLYRGHLPTCKQFDYDSDEYWKCAARSLGFNFRHQVATTRMGPHGAAEAVVDPELKVRGVSGLRVVDGGVLPFAVAGHTVAPIYMLAEKASDMIKDSWKDN